MRQPNWTRILTILLVVLASFAILYVVAVVLGRFTHAILLFVLAAMVAYVLSPLVNRLELAFRSRVVAIALSYLFLAIAIFAIGVLLFTPFIQQSQSLIDNLHTPSSASLRTINKVETLAARTHGDLARMKATAGVLVGIPSTLQQGVKDDLAALQRAVVALQNGTICGKACNPAVPGRTAPTRFPPDPRAETGVPPSYVRPLATQLAALQHAFDEYLRDPAGVGGQPFTAALADSASLVTSAQRTASVFSSMPILLLRAQTWLDAHGIRVDVHSKFGDAARQVSDQGALILDNAVTIIQATLNTLLNLVIVLIIAFYLLLDGRRLLRTSLHAVPGGHEEHVWYFVRSLDKVLGGYVRGQLILSTLAGVLAGGGAAALGVPYPLLIGLLTFILEAVPVIGPMVAFIPAVLIALVFNPPVIALLLFAWFTIFQQIVTNVLGPKIMGSAVGIHPLEAIAAVLVGYPLGGFLGAFLAVPLAGVIHIFVREVYAYFAHGQAFPTAPIVSLDRAATGSNADAPARATASETRTARG
ncbi:MAG TPA: AI-2E family transporter [Chloroflexota bacterium]|nr:AI-2E family transporter [Chloroflexota bacterium]